MIEQLTEYHDVISLLWNIGSGTRGLRAVGIAVPRHASDQPGHATPAGGAGDNQADAKHLTTTRSVSAARPECAPRGIQRRCAHPEPGHIARGVLPRATVEG